MTDTPTAIDWKPYGLILPISCDRHIAAIRNSAASAGVRGVIRENTLVASSTKFDSIPCPQSVSRRTGIEEIPLAVLAGVTT